ncbi:deoxyhypusine synthase [Candidatus Woesearchaeota archaeon]|nr:deoxyhypusine synthase [Candidatus Woesearchaeota archaeon]
MEPVKQIDIFPGMKVSELVGEMKKSGVMGAGRIAKAWEIFKQMISDKECKIFFGFAAAMVPGGMKNILIDMLENDVIDVLVVTGAALTHDLIEALGYKHFQGKAEADDKKLNKEGLDRIYDSFMPNKVYEGLEDFFNEIFESLPKETNIKDFIWAIGSKVKEKSILKICYDKKIPIFCPAIQDSGIGLMIWGKLAAGKKIKVDAFEDMKDIMKIAWDCKKAGVFYVGGGVPKNYIQQAMQFAPKGADYGVQVTTDRPQFGGSSGAELKEGISWGKMSSEGKFIDVYCDATIALPLIWAAVKDTLQ